jgi:hypothetical protein
MKKIIVILTLMMTTIINAQIPSDATLHAKIKANYKGATAIQLEGNGGTEKVYEDGVWKIYYKRSFHTNFKNPDYPGVTGVIYGSIQYIKAGNRFVFNKFFNRGTEMKGAPKPSIEVVRKLLKADVYNFVGHNNYNDIVGEISEINFVSNSKFKSDDLNHVEFSIKVAYSKINSNNELEKGIHFYEVHLYSEGFKKPWNKFQAFENSDLTKIISKQKLSEPELKAIKTLAEIDENNKSQAALKDLPKVEDAPKFQTDKQLFYYIQEKLIASTAQEAKAYLYKVLSKRVFERGLILKEREKEWIERLINSLNAYQSTYCQYPKVKEEQEGSITFYDKEHYRSTRMRAYEENGTWKIGLIHFIPPTQEEINKLAAIAGNCGTKPNLEVKEKIAYEIGDIVDIKFSNGTFTGEIDKKDSNFDNRYYVKLLDDGHGYWVNDDTLTPSKVKKVSFAVGDKIGVKFRSGTMQGTILEIKSNEYLIKFDDTGYKDMWLPKQQIEKR